MAPCRSSSAPRANLTGITNLTGLLDEVSLYNRALSASEIAAIYSAGGSGKCKVPNLLTQPQDQLGYWGGSVAFAAAAAGANPLSYQWQKDSMPVAGATTTSLLLTNLQLTNAGGYALRVTNVYGSATSSQAILTVKVADLSISLSALTTQNVAALTIGGLVEPDLRYRDRRRAGPNQRLDRANKPHTQYADECLV